MSRRIPAITFLFFALCICASGDEPDVRIVGPVSTKPLLTSLEHAIRQEKGIQITIDTDLTSVDALAALADNKAGIALFTRPLTLEDRSRYPDLTFTAVPIGMQVVALGVSSDLWAAGLHTITKEDMRAVYEQKITNWQKAGGPDEKIILFNFEEGQGVWEMFAEWLYGDNRKAPIPKAEKVESSEAARDALEFTPGAFAPLGITFVDGARCHALGIELSDRIARPTPEDVASGDYPIVRPLSAVVLSRPMLVIRTVTEYLTGPAGQALVKKTGAMGVEAVPKPAADTSGY